MASDIRERARQILAEVPPFGQQINSVGPTAGKFTKMTGSSQAILEANWKTGGIMTTCNAFVGWYGTQLGSKNYLGRFDIDTMVKKWGKEHAWIPASSGAQPKYGDIFRPKKFHIGISLDFEGGMWNTAESGQGGSKTGYDILKRKRSTWDPSLLQGWVDIALLFGEAPEEEQPKASTAPVPDWLPGWWVVSWRHETYYYFFDRSFGVSWTLVQPSSASQPPAGARDKGQVTIEPFNVVSIVWAATGSVEKFVKTPTTNEQMGGTWNGKEALSAVRL